jgi:hypothetical protein
MKTGRNTLWPGGDAVERDLVVAWRESLATEDAHALRRQNESKSATSETDTTAPRALPLVRGRRHPPSETD